MRVSDSNRNINKYIDKWYLLLCLLMYQTFIDTCCDQSIGLCTLGKQITNTVFTSRSYSLMEIEKQGYRSYKAECDKSHNWDESSKKCTKKWIPAWEIRENIWKGVILSWVLRGNWWRKGIDDIYNVVRKNSWAKAGKCGSLWNS